MLKKKTSQNKHKLFFVIPKPKNQNKALNNGKKIILPTNKTAEHMYDKNTNK